MKNILYFLSYLLFYFTPIRALLLAVGVIVFTDAITGIFAAIRRGEVISSKKMVRTISKIIFYSIAIILGRIMQAEFIPFIPIPNITAGYIGMVEFKSNMENISTITGLDIWTTLINKINSYKK
jgi:Bacteriophage holin family